MAAGSLIALLALIDRRDRALRAKLQRSLTLPSSPRAADVASNPYLLLRLSGWTFPLVDKVARACGVPMPERARQLVLCAARKSLRDSGCTILDSARLKADIRGLGWDPKVGKMGASAVPLEDRMQAYFDMLEDERDIKLVDCGAVAMLECLGQERTIFKRACLAPADVPDLEALAAAELLQGYTRMQLSQQQQQAVAQAFGSHHMTLLTGNPGCGKSACCDAIAHVARKLKLNCHFLAFTWLAALRISQVCEGVKATSIHKLVYALKKANNSSSGALFEGDDELLWFDKEEEDDASSSGGEDPANWSRLDLLVVDEASMASSSILYMLLSVLPPTCRLMLVGDDAQLPPIGFGQPFADLVAACRSAAAAAAGGGSSSSSSSLVTAPLVELTHVFRTDEPHIIDFSAACRSGQRPEWMKQSGKRVSFGDFAWSADSEPEAVLCQLQALLLEQQPSSCQVLVAGKQGPVGMWALNALAARTLRPHATGFGGYVLGQSVMCLNPDAAAAPVPAGTMGVVTRLNGGVMSVKWRSGASEMRVDPDDAADFMAHAFVVGDKVMYTSRAHAKLRNGQRGFVVEVLREKVRVDYGDGLLIWHTAGEQQDLQLAYAITVHKYQGNEAPHAVVVVHASHGVLLLSRNLLYTAVTRGKSRVTLFCESATLDKCLARLDRRSTLLAALLGGASF